MGVARFADVEGTGARSARVKGDLGPSGPQVDGAGSALWAKSDAGGSPHSLIGHLLDTAAVGELVHDEFLAPAAQRALDAGVPGRGRDLLRVLGGWHDVGKACPKFQYMPLRGAPEGREAELRRSLAMVGLTDAPSPRGWHHTRAGAIALSEYLRAQEWDDLRWIVPIIEGHHGRFGDVVHSRGVPPGHGFSPLWNEARKGLFGRVLGDLHLTLDALDGPVPSAAAQVALAGLVSLSDWVASSNEFPGVGLNEMTLDEARQRARSGWDRIGLTSGWQPHLLTDDAGLFQRRFHQPPRPLQELVVNTARSMGRPGLLVVEAPMGEGKTEAAFAAAEVLAHRFGFGGFVFAMPTQGTTDAMYDRCRGWVREVDRDLVVSLRHGKAMANDAFRATLQDEVVTGVDPDLLDAHGMPDPYGAGAGSDGLPSLPRSDDAGPAQWLLGRHRALLSPGVVGTVDQVLYAGTRTKYVSLRHAGLIGKVVIIDEVHAYDVYTEVFLTTLLRWCSDGGVPVILMSATLPPALRGRLVSAYTGGWSSRDEPVEVGEVAGYPGIVTALGMDDEDEAAVSVSTSQPWRPDLNVALEVLGSEGRDVAPIAERVIGEVSGGGVRARHPQHRRARHPIVDLLSTDDATRSPRTRRSSPA